MNGNEYIFNSPTYGNLSLATVRMRLLEYMEKDPEGVYHLIIGTDSQPKNGQGADFVTAILIHRVGKGGIYFWRRFDVAKKMALRERIYYEATTSLVAAEDLIGVLKDDGVSKYDIEIHVDVGKVGETRELIAEVVGMIRSSGYVCKTKPEAYGASKVADRHT